MEKLGEDKRCVLVVFEPIFLAFISTVKTSWRPPFAVLARRPACQRTRNVKPLVLS